MLQILQSTEKLKNVCASKTLRQVLMHVKEGTTKKESKKEESDVRSDMKRP